LGGFVVDLRVQKRRFERIWRVYVALSVVMPETSRLVFCSGLFDGLSRIVTS
jgi:hypothetical protein